jgi:hypothetical protein
MFSQVFWRDPLVPEMVDVSSLDQGIRERYHQ